jgi:hypothetical protein
MAKVPAEIATYIILTGGFEMPQAEALEAAPRQPPGNPRWRRCRRNL